MILQNVEQAIRPQFVWEDAWHTNKDCEGSRRLGKMVFIGLAQFHKFETERICLYLEMSEKDFFELSGRYFNYFRISIGEKNRKHSVWQIEFLNKLYTKTRLSQSYLQYNFNAPPIDYVDFLYRKRIL